VNIVIRNKTRIQALRMAYCFILQSITLKPVEIKDVLELDSEGNFPDE